MRAIGYIRCSTDKQENSIDAQDRRIRAYIELQGWDLVDIKKDFDGFSGDLDRPGVQSVIELVRAREIDVVVITKLDRLSRSTRDTSDLMAMFKKTGVKLIDIAQALDMSCAIGRFIVNIRAAVAEYEREMTGERTSEGLQNLKSQGFPAGPAPFGFQAQPRTAEEKNLKIRKPLIENPKEQKIIERIVEMRREGRSFDEIATALNKEGHRTRQKGKWHIAGVQRIFVNQEKS